MRFRGAVVAVGLLVGCAADPVDPGSVCPLGQVSRAGLLAVEIEDGSQAARDTRFVERDLGQPLDPVQGPVYFLVPTPLLFQGARWAEMHPACFSDEARVRVYALRDRAAATGEAGIAALRVESDEYDAVLAALRAS